MTIRFAAVGLNHNHILGMTDQLLGAGAELVWYYAAEPELAADYAAKYPQGKPASSAEQVLEDPTIQLVISAGIPSDRAPLGIRAMQHGKDYMADKPGFTTLDQLAEARRVQAETGRIYSVFFSERLGNRASMKAGELVHAGAIGQVLQTIGLGPHKIGIVSRPSWFFHRKYFGGILNDLASHQMEQFLYYTSSTSAQVVAAQLANFHYPQYPDFDDFGDMMVSSDHATGYCRVDWFTPDGLGSWGDGRMTILGTDGFIEIRKNIDIAGRPGGNHLILVDQKGTQYINCEDVPLTYGKTLVQDILNRTETTMPQAHCFLASELVLQAEQVARRIK
ncbi:MAG: Gfo/Idh/MocA family oxidoreductase [Anaerolineae bacterium]|nr:Gfo/Idh/MocA family oxidoreductase [Anaerolineae bacterium]